MEAKSDEMNYFAHRRVHNYAETRKNLL